MNASTLTFDVDIQCSPYEIASQVKFLEHPDHEFIGHIQHESEYITMTSEYNTRPVMSTIMINNLEEEIEHLSSKLDNMRDTYISVLRIKYPFVFANDLKLINQMKVSFQIKLEGTYKAPFIYPVADRYMKLVKEKINDWLNAGIIRRSSSPYAAPITCRLKKDGRLRLCVDYKRLNAVTVDDIGLKKEVIGRVFSTIDLKERFMQIPVHEGTIQKTAMITPV